MGWTPSLAGARRLARPAEDAHPIQKHGEGCALFFCGVAKGGERKG